MGIFEEEAARASLYRDNWNRRITFRHEQLRRLAGSTSAARALRESFAPVFRKDNYIEPVEAVEMGEAGGYQTPFDESGDDGTISGSSVRLPGTRHASSQNERGE